MSGLRGMTAATYDTLVDRLASLSRLDTALTFVSGEHEQALSYEELRARTLRIGQRLAALGFRKGDRLVLIVPDQRDFAELLLGAIWAGVVPVPLFPPFMLTQLSSYRRHLARVLRITESRALVTSDEVAELLGRDALPAATMRLTDVEGDGELGELPTIAPDDPVLLQFTSGSTADPKGVVVTHRTLMANVTAIGAHFGVVSGVDRGVSWLPLYHDMGLIGFFFLPIVDEGLTWYMSPLDFARSPTSWCELIHRVGGTISFAPNFAYGLLARRATDEQVARWDLASWRIAGCGAEPIQIETLRAFARRLAPAGFRPEALLPCYGMAEATLAMTLGDLDTPPRTRVVDRDVLGRERRAVPAAAGDGDAQEIVSCGAAIAGHELAVIDGRGAPLPDLREGEIAFRGPSVTPGYFGDELTEQTYRDGWLYTGDLGFLCGGEIYVTGRVKDLLIVGGRNYHPQDVEWCAQEEAGVRRGNVASFCVPDTGGERVIVVAEARGDCQPQELGQRVSRRIRASLGLTVSEVVIVARDTLPKTTSGKVRRAEARRRYVAAALERVATGAEERSRRDGLPS